MNRLLGVFFVFISGLVSAQQHEISITEQDNVLFRLLLAFDSNLGHNKIAVPNFDTKHWGGAGTFQEYNQSMSLVSSYTQTNSIYRFSSVKVDFDRRLVDAFNQQPPDSFNPNAADTAANAVLAGSVNSLLQIGNKR